MDTLRDRIVALDCDSVTKFTFRGVDTLARVHHIHDTDTMTIVFEWYHAWIKLNVRLNGIDAPELESKSPGESDVCRKGCQVLQRLIGNQIVRVILADFDKYGRPLATVYLQQPLEDGIETVNDYLVKWRYAKRYTGGTKVRWSPEELALVGIKNTASEETAQVPRTKKKTKPPCKRVIV
jgi:endonuclease YncB( thermonuclease family)